MMGGACMGMTFGQKVRYRRTLAGLTQEELGRLCNVSGMAISAYELGRAKPYTNTMDRLCKVFRCSPADMADDKEADSDDRNADTG